MIFVLTSSQDATADYLITVLKQRGIRVLRFDTDSSLAVTTVRYEVGNPVLRVNGENYSPANFTNVWYRRPERLQDSRLDDSPEGHFMFGEWAEAIEGVLAHIPVQKWMNYPPHNVAASHKIEQLSTAAKLGFVVPDTLVTMDPHDARLFYEKHNGEIIVKPISNGYLKRP